MSKCERKIGYLIIVLTAIITGGCSSDDSGSPAYSYATTSSKGDYSEWTLTGGVLNVTWNVIDSAGAIDYTHTISANCSSADSFGVRNCTVSSSSCAAGVSACPPAVTGSFDIMDVPGVALFVHTGSGASAQLHIGFAKDSSACTQNVSGDYTMIYTGLGMSENFGVYRSDADFINVLHADFGFDSTGATATPAVIYGTGSESEVFNDLGCVNGVRTRGLGGSSDVIRSMMTASGLFVLDFPAGQGGLVSFKTSNAASLADLANKSFGGITFPDNDDPEPVKAEFGPVSGSQVAITATINGVVENLNIKALATTATSVSPAYPDFTLEPAVYPAAVLYADYPNPATIPGLFKLDALSDTGRVVLAAMKISGKVVAVGMVYNYRTTFDINPGTGTNFSADGLYNTGNFLLFEK